MNAYEYWTNFAASFGTLYFGLMFAIAVLYALRPSNKATFEAASRLPLDED